MNQAVSCKKIKENLGNKTFSFETFSRKDVLDLIKQLPGNKTAVSNDIPVSVLKISASAYYEKLTDIFNNCIRRGTFPGIFKKSEVTLVFKKGDATSKTDYHPVSTLSNFLKIFEKLIYLQLNNYVRNKFSIYLTGFRKNSGTQNALLKMIETWKTKLNTGHTVGIIYMDLSKAFGSLNHELVIAKLKCYQLDQNAVEFFRSYLSNQYQCCKTNNTLGNWRKVIAGVPQGSILGPLLFNIFLNDIFFFLRDAYLGNYADDSTLYGYNKNLETVICNLSQEFSILPNWFYHNYMVLNPENCHFMLFGVKKK